MARAYYVPRRDFFDLLIGRIARLYPLHALTLIWVLVLALQKQEAMDASYVQQSLLLLHNVGLPPNRWGLNFPSWSISVEFVVSLLFFFLILKSDQKWTAALLLGVSIALCVLAAQSAIHPAENLFGFINVGLLSGVGWFGIGCAAYLMSAKYRGWFMRYGAITPLMIAGLLFLFILPSTAASDLALGLIVFGVLAFSASNDEATFLSCKPFVLLGAISYSIYLLHMPVYWTLELVLGEQNVRGALGKALAVSVIIGVSVLSYYYFELPANAFFLESE
jgi:peptidoglycan/LPS O-acetylase OafA/YrhL